MTDVSLSPDVVVIDGVLRVSSLEIAERFCKRHTEVLRSIRIISLECEEDFNERNFALVEYADAKGEMRPMYQLSRDGFTLLAMGFAGKKALEWKIKYIQAFNVMEEALKKKREKLALKEAKKKALPSTKSVALSSSTRNEIDALVRKVDFYFHEIENTGNEIGKLLVQESREKDPELAMNLRDPKCAFATHSLCSVNFLFSSINFNIRSLKEIIAFRRQSLQ